MPPLPALQATTVTDNRPSDLGIELSELRLQIEQGDSKPSSQDALRPTLPNPFEDGIIEPEQATILSVDRDDGSRNELELAPVDKGFGAWSFVKFPPKKTQLIVYSYDNMSSYWRPSS